METLQVRRHKCELRLCHTAGVRMGVSGAGRIVNEVGCSLRLRETPGAAQ